MRSGRTAPRIVTRFAFCLYVAGQTERSLAAEANLRMLCESLLPGDYDLEVIDAVEQPGLAEEQRILATPTVLRLAPAPQRRVIGDLSDHRRTARALGLPAGSGRAGEIPPGDPDD
jgi:circadian clock protein KaiB